MLKKISGILVIVSSLLFALARSVFAFGITPAEINVSNLMPGGHYEKEIYVTRPVTEAGEELKVVLDPQLGEMLGWFKFMPGNEFDFPVGKNTTSFNVIIDVPQNADLKNYTGQITAKGISDNKASEGVTMVSAAVLGVQVTTSNVEAADLKVLSMSAPDVNEGDPVRLLLNIKNSGNSESAPDKVALEVMDLFEKPIESLTTSDLEKVQPFTTKEIKAQFNSNLDKGQYRVDASVIFKGKEIFRQKLVLTVNAKPAKTQENITIAVPNKEMILNTRIGLTFAALGILILVIIFLIYVRSEKENDLESEKKLSKFVHQGKLRWLLIIPSVILIIVGLMLYFFGNRLLQNANFVRVKEVNTEVVSPSVSSVITPTVKPVKSKTDVKGISAVGEEQSASFVVSQPGEPGTYPIYEGPSFDADMIYQAEDGETFNVLRVSGDWFNVTLSDGTLGWLHRSSVKRENK